MDESKPFVKKEIKSNISSNGKNILSKQSIKTHTKTFSVEIRPEKSKSPIPTINSINGNSNNSINSNIPSINKIPISSKTNLIHHTNYKSSKSNYMNNSNNHITNSKSNSNTNISNRNLNANNTNMNFNNNFNSFTLNGNVKSEINLRNYINNRVNINSKKVITATATKSNNNRYNNVIPGHSRSKSNNLLG